MAVSAMNGPITVGMQPNSADTPTDDQGLMIWMEIYQNASLGYSFITLLRLSSRK